MKQILLALTVTAALLFTGALWTTQTQPSTRLLVSPQSQQYSQEIIDAWTQWKSHHGKLYGSSADESFRLNNFSMHFNNIKAANNNPNFTFTSALNKFSDLSVAEFKSKFLGHKEQDRARKYQSLKGMKVSSFRDWTLDGAVTPVKDQGACGSCWAFSATGALEGLDYLLNGTLRSFSESMFMLCDKHYPNNGCNGGNSAITMMWTETNGVVTEDRMPYRPVDTGTCYWSKYSSVFFNNDMLDVPKDDNEEMTAAIDRQPISIAVAAEKFMHYSNGIFNDWSCGSDLDHAILATGYSQTSAGQKYYSVKNSWGASWGESGYIRFDRHTGKEVGICGLTSAASYPTGQNPHP